MPPVNFRELRSFKALVTSNIFLVVLRLAQFFFAGVIIGLMGYFIHLNLLEHAGHPPVAYVYALVVAVFSLTTQVLYVLGYDHFLTFAWEFTLAAGYIIAMIWVKSDLSSTPGTLWCKWSELNPFGSNYCVQYRAMMMFMIVQTVLWGVSGAVHAHSAHVKGYLIMEK